MLHVDQFSLLSCIGELYKKIIYNRLFWIIESKDFLLTLQFGFRKNEILYRRPTKLLKVIRDFLQNRSFQIKINNSLSDTKNSTCGVHQVSILSPFIFSILYHNIPDTQNFKILMYTDDISAYTIDNTIEEAATNI